MSVLWGYSDFLKLLGERPEIKRGLVADANVLIAATYESDVAHDTTIEFFDFVSENETPVFCNVNSRAEFLEIHRRIIFTEALVDFARTVDRTHLSVELSKQLHSIVTRAGASATAISTGDNRGLFRLSEPEIKWFKVRLMKISNDSINLWSQICTEKIGNKLGHVWDRAVDELGLNFLSLRKEDDEPHIVHSPDWADVVRLIEMHGLSSADAMVLNLFLASKFTALVTSDLEVAATLQSIQNHKKICFLPDHLKNILR